MGLSGLIGPGAARRDRDLEDRWCAACGGYSVRRFTTAEQCSHYLAEHERWSQRVEDEPYDTAEGEVDEDEERAQELLSEIFSVMESPGALRVFDARDREMGILPTIRRARNNSSSARYLQHPVRGAGRTTAFPRT